MSSNHQVHNTSHDNKSSGSNTLRQQPNRTTLTPQPKIDFDELTPSDILYLQRTIGNQAVTQLIQRQSSTNKQQFKSSSSTTISSDAKSSSIQRHANKASLEQQVKTWPPIPRFLMQGVLSQGSASAAAKKVYNNMFAYALPSWFYKASSGNSKGDSIIEGGASVGMCETYRNAFKYMLEHYVVPLTQDYDPFADGFNIQEGQGLVSTKFVTKPGLALLGRKSGYNVSQELDAATGAVTPVDRYLFSSHWQLTVNGDTYDPLFKGVNQADIDWVITDGIDNYYRAQGADIAFQADTSAGPTAGNEFAGQYVMIRNADQYETLAKQSDDVQFAHSIVVGIHNDLEVVKQEWVKKRKKLGSTKSWRKSIQGTRTPIWKNLLLEVRTRSDTISNGCGYFVF
jgi:hypothetical protein